MSSLHEIALTFIPGVGVVTAKVLLDYLGDARSIFDASRKDLISVPGIGPKTAEAILSQSFMQRAEEELKFLERYKIKPLFISSHDYPWRLRNCYDAPVMLYYKGNAELNADKIVSIVGTRNATEYARDLTQHLVEGLKAQNVLVVSGLAYGIDVAAHKACLNSGVPTVGVVGHGLERIYPAQHRAIAESMLSTGGLLTEFASQTKPDNENFPKRNRIFTGLADAT